MNVLGPIILFVFAFVWTVTYYAGYFLWICLKAAFRFISIQCIRERGLSKSTSKAKRCYEKMSEFMDEYKCFAKQNHSPRSIKKANKFKDKFYKEAEKFNVLEGKIKDEMLKRK